MGGEVERLYAARAADLSQGAQQLLLLAATADTADLDLVLGASTALGIDEREPAGGRGERPDLGRARCRRCSSTRSCARRSTSSRRSWSGSEGMRHGRLLDGEANADRRAGTWSGRPPGPTTSSQTCWKRPRTGPHRAVDRRLRSTGGSGPQSSAAPMTTARGDCSRRGGRRAGGSAGARSAAAGLGHRLCTWLLRVGRGSRRCWARSRCGTGHPRRRTTSCWRRLATWRRTTQAAALDSLVLAGEAATFLGDPRLTLEVSALRDGAERRWSCSRRVGGRPPRGAGQALRGQLVGGLADPGRRHRRVHREEPTTTTSCARGGLPCTWAGSATARTLYARAVAQARTSSSAGQLAPMLNDWLRSSCCSVGSGRGDARSRGAAVGRRSRSRRRGGLVSLATVHAYRGEDAECRAQADSRWRWDPPDS